MRITNSMMVSNYMNNLNTNLNKMSKISEQLATNRKYAHISDDPMSVIFSQQARERLRKLDQYQSNVATAQDWLTQVESSLMDFNKILASAYESVIDAATDVKSDADRKNAAEYIQQLRDQILTTLNSTFGDKYMFGGYNTTGHVDSNGDLIPPFTVEDEDYLDVNGVTRTRSVLLFNGIKVSNNTLTGQVKQDFDDVMNQVLTFDVGLSVDMEVSIRAMQLLSVGFELTDYQLVKDANGNPIPVKDENGNFVFDCEGNMVHETEAVTREANLYELLDALYNEMMTSNKSLYTDQNGEEFYGLPASDPRSGAEVLTPFVNQLQTTQSGMLSMTANVGGRTQRLELLASRYDQDFLNYTQMKSDAEDMDQAEIIMNYKMAATVYDAALATGSYIIQNTLMNFLK